jgi:hypothetical protein
MANERADLEQVVHELRSANAALVEEVRGLRQAVVDTLQQQQRRRERLALWMVISYLVIPALAAGCLWLLLPLPKEDPWEQQQRQQQQQLDRTNRAIDRAEKLLGRWEKVTPRE